MQAKLTPELEAQLKALGLRIPEGWDALDPASEANRENAERSAQERYQRAKVIASGVSDEALAVMRTMTIEEPAFQVNELGLLNGVAFGILREGQNGLVRWIELQKRIAAAGPGGKVEKSTRRKRS